MKLENEMNDADTTTRAIARRIGGDATRSAAASPSGTERWITACPAHSDQHGSCVVVADGPGATVTCLAGCEGSALADALVGLGMTALPAGHRTARVAAAG